MLRKQHFFGAVLVLPLLIAAYGYFVEPNRITVDQVVIPDTQLHQAWGAPSSAARAYHCRAWA